MLIAESARKKFRADRAGMCSLAVVLLFLLVALGVELYGALCEYRGTIPAYLRSDPAHCYEPPSPAHWMGTDYQGRDVALRALAGSATALKVGLIAGGIAVVIGVTLGLAAGYFGGTIDEGTVWLNNTFSAMPTLLFILSFALLVSQEFLSPGMLAFFQATAKILRTEPGMLGVYCAIGLTGWVTLCRVVRAETMKLKKRPFVSAALVAGVRPCGIIFHHILPNVFHLVIIYFTTLFAGAVMLEVIAGYLGLGAQTLPSWGVMISDGQQRLWAGAWWEITAASILLFLLILALNTLGDSLRDALDPRKS